MAAGEYVTAVSYNDMATGRPSDAVGGPVSPPTVIVIAGMDTTPAAQMDQQSARTRARVMIGGLQAWLFANPHPLEGDDAAVSNFFRDLETRRLARVTAGDLGREVEKDEIDAATSGPPPEYYQLADLAHQAAILADMYAAFLASKTLEVPADIATVASDLKAKATTIMAQAPAPAPEPVPAPAAAAA